MGQDLLQANGILTLTILASLGKSEDINPELKPILEKLDLDKKYHELANEIYNKADRSISQDKDDPLKHLEGLNFNVRRLLKSIPRPDKLVGTETEAMGKKILNFANEEFQKYFVSEPDLRTYFNMSDKDIVKFLKVYEDTKSSIEKLNVIFDCA